MRSTPEAIRQFWNARLAPAVAEAFKAETKLLLAAACAVVLAIPATLLVSLVRGTVDLDIRVYDCSPGLTADLAQWLAAPTQAHVEATFAPKVDQPGTVAAPARYRVHYVAADFAFLRLSAEGPPPPFQDHCRPLSYWIASEWTPTVNVASALLPMYAAIALLVPLRLRMRREHLVAGKRSFAALRGFPWWCVGAGIATGAAAALLVRVLGADVAAVRDAGPLDDLFARAPIAAFGIALVAAPLFEELLFRRWLFDGFLRAGMPLLGAGWVSVNFALLHVHWHWTFDFAVVLAVYVGISLMLCAVYARTRNVIASMAAHAAHNATSLALALWWSM